MLALPGFQPAAALAGPAPGFYRFDASNLQLGVAFQILAYLDRDGNFTAAGDPPAMLNIFPGTPAMGVWKAGSSNALQIKAITKLFRLQIVGQDGVLEPHGKATIEGSLAALKDVNSSYEGDIKVSIFDASGKPIQDFPLHLIGKKVRFEDLLRE